MRHSLDALGGGSEDYLHEAALADSAPSLTFYDPNNDGNGLTSLGVHEHWNNEDDKQYSRNLGIGNGIELVMATDDILFEVTPGDFKPDGDVDFVDFAVFVLAWQSKDGDENWNQACDISEPNDDVIDYNDLDVFSKNWLAEAVPDGLIAPGAELVEIYSDSIFFEGPCWDPVGQKLYFVAWGTSKQLLRLDTLGSATVWIDDPLDLIGINGTFISTDGRMITAEVFAHKVMSYVIGSSGPEDPQLLAYDPTWMQPNDLCQTASGNIYFTDPDWAGGHTNSAVYRRAPNGTITTVITDMVTPNGIIASNDGSVLYVADSIPKLWRSYPINPDGTIGAGTVFFDPASSASEVPDGMTIDEFGNIYMTGMGSVWIVSPAGELLEKIDAPVTTSNVTFGGADGKTLYITCDTKVYSLQMLVHGN